MTVSFKGKRTRESAEGHRTKAVAGFERKAGMKLDQLDAALSLLDLDLPGNRVEALKGDRMGQYRIRSNEQWRIGLEWPKGSTGPISVPTDRITAILHSQRAITGDTALRLGHFFGTSAQFWMSLQTIHDLRIAERKAGPTIDALPAVASTA